jgi:hypothetical protein
MAETNSRVRSTGDVESRQREPHSNARLDVPAPEVRAQIGDGLIPQLGLFFESLVNDPFEFSGSAGFA